MTRVILHSDANSFYASVELLYRPELRGKAVAVCGDPEARHGIVLTKSQAAKRAGVKTGMAIWQAKECCPDLVVLPPNYPLYVHYSRKLRGIYLDYGDNVEAFGLDENWIDLSAPNFTLADGARAADEIRRRVREELGITVSIGVSYNKVFAKLGSDYKKPDATTVISPENYAEIVRPLPVSDLLYVGPRTARKLIDRGVYTIGDLADCDMELLRSQFGKNGVMLKAFAMGLDTAPVAASEAYDVLKSVGNSATPPRDLTCPADVRCMAYLLSESVGSRMRECGFRCRNISVSLRTADLAWHSCQRMLDRATGLTDDIAREALNLFGRYAALLPYRSIGVTCGALEPDTAPVQLDLFGEQQARDRIEARDRAIDQLRRRYGHQIVVRGAMLIDRQFAGINPRDMDSIHPVAFVTNRSGVIRGV